MSVIQLDLFGSHVTVIPSSGNILAIESVGTCAECDGAMTFYVTRQYANFDSWRLREYRAVASSVVEIGNRRTAYGAEFEIVIPHCPTCAPRCEYCENLIDGDNRYQSSCENHCETVCNECCECFYCESCDRYIPENSSRVGICTRNGYAHCSECCECVYCHRCDYNVSTVCDSSSYCEECCEIRCGCGGLSSEEMETLREGSSIVETQKYVSGAFSTVGHKFGCELEMIAPSPRRALEILANAGLRTSTNSRDLTAWRAKHDGSVRGEDCEVVSPILSGIDGFKQLEIALAALVANGARVDSSCGGHVHVDMTDRDGKDLARVLKFYRTSEVAINRIIGDRARNSYCRSVDTHEHRAVEVALENASTTDDAKQVCARNVGSRYHACNLWAFYSHETVEFRSLEGCLDNVRLSSWVRFLIALVRGAMFETAQPSTELGALLTSLRGSGLDEQSAAYLARFATVSA